MNNFENDGLNSALSPSSFGMNRPFIFKKSKGHLKSLSKAAGICVLGFLGISQLLALLLRIDVIFDMYLNNLEFRYAFEAIYAAVGIGIPFLLLYLLRKNTYKETPIPFAMPKNKKTMLLIIMAGISACLIGSYITSFIVTFVEASFGIKFLYSQGDIPVTSIGILMFFVRSAFVPAFIEEFALRGVIMQPLRRYGNTFAIVMSALVFALMHGNMVQLPFAFIAGIAIGYAVIATESIWTGVIIHLLNNGLSVTMAIIANRLENNFITMLMGIFVIGIIGIGFICALLYFNNRNRVYIRKPQEKLMHFLFVKDYIFTLPLILAITSLMVQTVMLIDFSGMGIWY